MKNPKQKMISHLDGPSSQLPLPRLLFVALLVFSLEETARAGSLTILPATQVVPPGSQISLTISGAGAPPMSYQWRFNGIDIPGAKDPVLTLKGLRYDQAGYYNAVVSNNLGEVISPKALVTVQQLFIWGTTSPYGVPTNVPPGTTNLISVAAGGRHVLGLRADGTVMVWGNNAADVAYVPEGLDQVVAVAAGYYHNVALRSNGTVVAWGNSGAAHNVTNVPSGLADVVAVSAWGGRYGGGNLALKADGTVVTWGDWSLGQTNVPPSATNIIGIAGGGENSLALRADGAVVAWGNRSPANTNVPPYVTNLIAIATGPGNHLGLRHDGTVIAWGTGPNGGTNVPPGLSNVVALSAGYPANFAAEGDGTPSIWANRVYNLPTPAGLSNVFAVSISSSDSGPGFAVALAGDGSPALTLQPLSRSYVHGTRVQLNGRASGVQPLSYQWKFGDSDISGATNISLTISNIQPDEAGDYRVVVSNRLGASSSTTAKITLSYPGTLAEALNTTNLVWTSRGTNAPWITQNEIRHAGDAAARTGPIRNGELSELQTTVTGPGILSFWWKVSSEEGFDVLSFYDGTYSAPRASISGDQDWRQVTWRMPAGTQTVWWSYYKDPSVSFGDDAGWLDQVTFTPDPPRLSAQPAGLTGTMGTDAVLSVATVGAPPLSYQWLKDGANLPGKTHQELLLTNLTRRTSGSYSVRVTNSGGSILSSNAVVVVNVPQRFSEPIALQGGRLVLMSGDADGGLLTPEDLGGFEFQTSTNLVDWTALPNPITLTNGFLRMEDTDTLKYPIRYYHVLEHR